MNNPILTEIEESNAPWNDDFKDIEVTVSQCLSSSVVITVPKNLEDYNSDILRDFVKEQVILPSETISNKSNDIWYVDDFNVSI